MVQFIVTNNDKKLQCEITSLDDPHVWRITTPRKCTIELDNLPCVPPHQNCKYLTVDEGSRKELFSICWAYRCINENRSNYFYYCPVGSCWKMHYFITKEQMNGMIEMIMASLKQGVIQLALEHDRKEMMLVYLEHLCTRQSLEAEMNGIVVEASKNKNVQNSEKSLSVPE